MQNKQGVILDRRFLKRQSTDSVNARRADEVDAKFVLAHSGNALRRSTSGRKVNVREFRHRMAERIINLTQRAITAVNVGDGDLGDMSGAGGGEGFDAVADDKDDMGLELREGLGEGGDGLAGGGGG